MGRKKIKGISKKKEKKIGEKKRVACGGCCGRAAKRRVWGSVWEKEKRKMRKPKKNGGRSFPKKREEEKIGRK